MLSVLSKMAARNCIFVKCFFEKTQKSAPLQLNFECSGVFWLNLVTLDPEPVFELIDKITSKPTHFTEEDVLTLLPNLPDEESIYQLVNSTDAIFTENGLNELCDYGVDESLIRKISKRSGIPYADPDEPDEEISLKEAQPKKPGLFSSILMGMALAGSPKPKNTGKCTGDCAHCPPHYGYRYGRWYYGHGHTHGCEFCGNGGCSGKCNID